VPTGLLQHKSYTPSQAFYQSTQEKENFIKGEPKLDNFNPIQEKSKVKKEKQAF